MNILHLCNKSLVQKGFFKNSVGNLLQMQKSEGGQLKISAWAV